MAPPVVLRHALMSRWALCKAQAHIVWLADTLAASNRGSGPCWGRGHVAFVAELPNFSCCHAKKKLITIVRTAQASVCWRQMSAQDSAVLLVTASSLAM